jgi:hypothetical protein
MGAVGFSFPAPSRSWDEAGTSQTGYFARVRQRFLERNAFDFSGLDFCHPMVDLGFPRRGDRRVNAAVPRNHDPVNQFRDNFPRHFARLLYNLIQRHRHESSLAYKTNFDKSEGSQREGLTVQK